MPYPHWLALSGSIGLKDLHFKYHWGDSTYLSSDIIPVCTQPRANAISMTDRIASVLLFTWEGFFFFFFFWLHHATCVILGPWLRIEPTSLAVKCGVLISGPPGKSGGYSLGRQIYLSFSWKEVYAESLKFLKLKLWWLLRFNLHIIYMHRWCMWYLRSFYECHK